MSIPICKIARETGDVPISCLFKCDHGCRSRHYTGVGSRQTPAPVLALMRGLAVHLAQHGYTLRSGGANGADTAFEAGAHAGSAEIYLPWAGFNERHGSRYLVMRGDPLWERATALATAVHPFWSNLSNGARALHARNVFQVLGRDLETPSKFLLCWTPCGGDGVRTTGYSTGGTRTAIVIAEQFHVPVFNLAQRDALDRFYTAWQANRWAE